MNSINKNVDVIEHILEYCQKIQATENYFGDSYTTFSDNFIYRDAVSMSLLQIGELTGHLSEDFKAKYSEIPWRSIRGLRNIVAHNYGDIDVNALWETLKTDLPKLRTFCTEIIASYSVLEQKTIEPEDEDWER